MHKASSILNSPIRRAALRFFLGEVYWGRKIGVQVATWSQFTANILSGLILLFIIRPLLIFMDTPVWNFLFNHHLMLFSWDNSIATFLVAVFVMDFTYYLMHRLMHASSFVWIFHSTHHSDDHVNVSTGLRLSFSGLTFILYFPIALFGFPKDIFWASITLVSLYPLWLHSRLIPKIPKLEWLIFTPSGHRVHHGFNDHYRNKNFGGLFTIFDRIFGTYQIENEAPVYFNSKISTDNIWKMQTQEAVFFWQLQKERWQKLHKKGEVKPSHSDKPDKVA